MASATQSPILGRFQLMRFCLWASVLGWGLGLGGKLFDLLVASGAWSASPPASLALLPYGPRFPINPGDFFQPLSIVMAVSVVAALICGWKTPREFRLWLWLPVIMFLIIWAIIPYGVLADDPRALRQFYSEDQPHGRGVSSACTSLNCSRWTGDPCMSSKRYRQGQS